MEMTLEKHHDEVMDKLHNIDEDTDCILKKIGGEYMTDGFDSGALMGMLANKGVDPAVVAMLSDRRDRGDWGDGGFLALFLLLILCGGGNGFGWGNRGEGFATAGLERSINAASDYGMLMDTLNSNGTKQEIAMQNLAQSLNCSTGQIQVALSDIKNNITMSQGNLQFAVQNAQNQLQAQLADCCCRTNNNITSTACSTQREIERQGCSTRSEIAETRYNMASQFAAQTSLLQSQHCETLNAINNGFAGLELRDLQRELDQKNAMINDLKLQVSQEQQTAALIAALRTSGTTTSS